MKDWHIHSDYSDSSRTVEQIIQIAKEVGCTSISITDHDSVDGTQDAMKYKSDEFNVISGIEISAWDNKISKEIHILGYNFNLDAKHINALCEYTIKQRKDIAFQQVEILNNLGYDVSMNEVYENQKNSKTIYKQHILKILIEKGITDQYYGDFYKMMFKNNGPCQFKISLPSVEYAIESIHRDNGIAILAHPFNSKCIDEIQRYKEMGIDGIETNHSSQNAKERIVCHNIAIQYDLIETGGSDNHGEYGNEPEIGSGLK